MEKKESGYVPGFEYAVALMDDTLREDVHQYLAPCSEIEFLEEYMIRHFAKYGEDFEW